ncbi:MAG: hypothetical protein PGN08_14770 [Sphingomonas taxi]
MAGSPKPDARYQVVDGRVVMSAGAAARVDADLKPISQKAAAFETRTGYRSAQRIAQEEAVPLIRAARSWDTLHRSLAEVGISYDTIGTNGVILSVGNEKVRASAVDRSITCVRLEKRLGDFVPRAAAVEIAARDAKGDRLAKAFRADEYRGEIERWKRWQKPSATPHRQSMPPIAHARLPSPGKSRPNDPLQIWKAGIMSKGRGALPRRGVIAIARGRSPASESEEASARPICRRSTDFRPISARTASATPGKPMVPQPSSTGVRQST